jgi:glycosyltransferase involved in cell wall biosynthesis
MKIVVIHQYYLMPGQPGGSRFNEFSRLWSAAGHDVTVIAGTVDYASGATPERYRGKWLVREQDGAVSVVRCHVPTTYGRGYLGRAWAFFGWVLSSSTAAALLDDADVVIATSPPLVAALPGWFAAKLRRRRSGARTPWIFEIRDLWPESAVTTGVLSADGLLTKALYALEAWGYRSADAINVLTPAFLDDIVGRGLAPREKISFVPNGADVSLFTPGPRDNAVRRAFGWGSRFVVMYAGAHGRANAVEQLVGAAQLLRGRPEILIATVGDGPERAAAEEAARRAGLDNIQFCGPQPKERMVDFVNACDVGAAVLQDNPTFRTVYPNKVFDYMACERPTLLAIDGVARSLVVDQARAGVFAAPEDPRAIAAAILGMHADPEGCAEMGRRGRAWVLANATRESLAERYLAIMESLIDRGGRRPAVHGAAHEVVTR